MATFVITPLISADTWLGAAGCASGSQTCSGTRPAFDPAPISATISTTAATSASGGFARDRIERIAALRAGQQAKTQQQRQAAEGRHDQIDEAGPGVAFLLMVRHHQRPGGQRHQLPREEKGEGVVGDDHQRHGGQEGGIERQDAFGMRLMPAVAEGEQAGAGAADADEDQEKPGQRVEPQIRADPGQSERQDHALDGTGQAGESLDDEPSAENEAAAINQDAPGGRTRGDGAGEGQPEQSQDHPGDVVS